MALRISLVVCLSSGLAYWHLHDTLFERTQQQLDAYVEQRGIRDSQMFQLAEQNLATMATELRLALRNPPVDGLAEFERRWQQRADGTWRQRDGSDLQREPSLFHGRQVPLGDDLKRRLGLFSHLVAGWGRLYRHQFLNTYITTPQNSVMNLWPGVDWGGSAEPDLDVRAEEYVYVADHQHNPQRKTAWTGLYYDKVARVWMVSVEKPVDVDGEWVATIGHDITLDELMRRAIEDRVATAQNFLVREDGRLIAHPDFMARIVATGGALGVDDLGPAMQQRFCDVLARARDPMPGWSSDGSCLLAVRRIAGPGWLFVVEYPDELIDSGAMRSAQVVFGLGLLSLLAELMLMSLVLRREVARPLDQLTASTDRVAAGELNVVIDVRRSDELGQLASSFNAMIRAVAERDTRLAGHAAALEATVAGRTAELRESNAAMRLVLDNVREGLVSIDLTGKIVSPGSRAFAQWFPGESSQLADRLATVSEDLAATFRLALAQLAEDLLPREVAMAQMPTRVSLPGAELSIGYRALESAADSVGLLVIFSDITADLARAEADAEQRMVVRVVQSMIRDREGLLGFLAEVDALVARFVEGQDSFVEDLRTLHTLKGSAAVFGLSAFADVSHALEHAVLASGEVTPLHREQLRSSHTHCCELVSAVIGQGQRELVSVPRVELDAVAVALIDIAPAVANRVSSWTLDSVDARLDRLADSARAAAQRLGKPEPVVERASTGLRLDGPSWTSFWSVCVHLLRNAVDHGIERPEQRQRLGKPPQGHIWLGAQWADDYLVITVADDGAGIDWQAVRRAAAARGLPADTHEQCVAALFADGLTTKTNVTAVSGRGVGLAAVRAEVERRGGSIDVESTRGRGTRFVLRMPSVVAALVT